MCGAPPNRNIMLLSFMYFNASFLFVSSSIVYFFLKFIPICLKHFILFSMLSFCFSSSFVYADINVMIEGMTDGGNKKRGKLITLEFAYEGESKVIYNYLKSFPQETCLVDRSPITMLGTVKVEAIEHQHGIPNYGYKFSYDKTCVSIITDTRYFPELSERYMGSTTMIVNVPYYDFPEGKHPKHLNISDVKDILVKVKPRKVFLTHFGENIFQHDVYGIAASLEKELGIEVNVAETGKEFKLI